MSPRRYLHRAAGPVCNCRLRGIAAAQRTLVATSPSLQLQTRQALVGTVGARLPTTRPWSPFAAGVIWDRAPGHPPTEMTKEATRWRR
jgi:hypothetical protein